MTLRSDLRENRWLRAQFAVFIAAFACLAVMVALGSAWAALAGVACAMAGGLCWRPARRTEKALKAAATKAELTAKDLRTPRAPDAGQDQCPVCGCYGLTELVADDKLMQWSDGRPLVVAWGRKRAHWDCAEWSPYVPTEAEKERDTHFREHHGTRRNSRCDWCFSEDVRWEEKETQRRFEESWPELMEQAATGAQQIRINREADPTLKHWLINLGAPSRHMDILAIESCEKARDGFGWIARLVEPLRHGLFTCEGSNGPIVKRMMPLDSERLWNRDAGRPYTRTELGLCDCAGYAPGGVNGPGRLRASIDADTIAALFAEVNDRPQHMSTEGGWLLRDKGWRG